MMLEKHSVSASCEMRASTGGGRLVKVARPGSVTPWFVLLAIVIVLLACEGLAWAFCVHFGERLGFPDPSRYVAEAQTLSRARRAFDAELGWRKPYPTPFGERPRSEHHGVPWVATFGDSFTHGDEVADHETWSERLSRRLEVDVYNFGSGAYGMDQMLLRFEREITRRPTRHVVMAFISGDIRRNMTHYWRFLQPKGAWPLTKPRFRLDGDDLVLLPNPIRQREHLSRLLDPRFVDQLGRGDWYYDRMGLVRSAPPYSRLLVRPAFWRGVIERRSEMDLWTLDAPSRVARAILLRFARGARAAGAIPTVVHLPVVDEIQRYRADGTVPAAETVTRTFCTRHAIRCVFPLAALRGERATVAQLFTRGNRGGHYSPLGHERIAALLDPVLRQSEAPASESRRTLSEGVGFVGE